MIFADAFSDLCTVFFFFSCLWETFVVPQHLKLSFFIKEIFWWITMWLYHWCPSLQHWIGHLVWRSQGFLWFEKKWLNSVSCQLQMTENKFQLLHSAIIYAAGHSSFPLFNYRVSWCFKAYYIRKKKPTKNEVLFAFAVRNEGFELLPFWSHDKKFIQVKGRTFAGALSQLACSIKFLNPEHLVLLHGNLT